MQQSEAFDRQLRAHYAVIVEDTFARARHCLSLARTAQQAGDCAGVRKWVHTVRMLRMAAAEWRNRAQRIAPVLVCLLWSLGCAKAPSRELDVGFDVQPSDDGESVVWTLHFSRDQYHAMLDGTADGAEVAKVHELIAAGLKLHHMVGCSPREKTVIKLGSGDVAFVGSCALGTHVMPVGGI